MTNTHIELCQESNTYKSFICEQEEDFKQQKDKFKNEINQLKVQLKNKEGVIKALNEQIGEDGYTDFSPANPFSAWTEESNSEENSLFEELGGEQAARSFSIVPKDYKNLAKSLKRRLLFIEKRAREFKDENKELKDKCSKLENELTIQMKEADEAKLKYLECK